ncbi:molybdenum ABC transporter ATP-binding protein [Methylogaea oryzae]|uniref:Molybdenum import ATP-binding protein ModC n=2 Tax=Methylogaea oryzae TaxID=1295382 RepID=A0A8D4VQI8_9GAMM|nr:molybdenum ABC transporter ATP-binding protein [Methylogaea oryzae]BBL70789.1 molybdenum import ATP-binding protein ModC [Methylogaea oryzae]
MLRLDVVLSRGRFTLAAQLEADAPVTGLFGRSGSGKSTLLAVAAGLARPQRGRVELDGEVLFDSERGICLPAHRRRVGLVFQDSQLFPHYSVRGNLLYGCRRPGGNGVFRFDDIVDLLELAPLLQARPRQLSGGERQRVALGRSLLAAPRLLLLDEPLASLDQGLKAQILPFLKRIKDELGLPMVYVSHSLAEILHLTDRLALVAEGRVVAAGVLQRLVAEGRLAEAKVAVPENILAASVVGHDPEGGCTEMAVGGQVLRVPMQAQRRAGETAYLALAAGDVALARHAVAGTSIQNQIGGRVVGVREFNGAMRIAIDAGAPLLAEVSRHACAELDLREGAQVYCLIKARSFHYLTDGWDGGDGSSGAPSSQENDA